MARVASKENATEGGNVASMEMLPGSGHSLSRFWSMHRGKATGLNVR